MGITRNGRFYDDKWDLLYTPLVLLKPPMFLEREYAVVTRDDMLRFYDKLNKESGKTVFLIRVGTFEYVTKKLQEYDKIKVVDDFWETEVFMHFHSKKISMLILKVLNYPLYYPITTAQMVNHQLVKKLEDDIIKTVIPSFPLKCIYRPEPIKLGKLYKYPEKGFVCGISSKKRNPFN